MTSMSSLIKKIEIKEIQLNFQSFEILSGKKRIEKEKMSQVNCFLN